MKIAAVYESVTRSIIAVLERGTAPWVKPWKAGKRVGIMPANAIGGHPYRGITVPFLWHAADTCGFPTHSWFTFKQALDAGGHVKKGAKGTQIIFTKRISITDGDDEERRISMLRAFTVFNVAQVEGIEALLAIQEPPPPGAIDTFVAATAVDVRHGGDRACYVPSRDFIALPNPSDFASPEHYDATKPHELVHCSGGEKRLMRDLNNRFGAKAYAAEELNAELGAAFLRASRRGGPTASCRVHRKLAVLLKEDDHAIFTAASKASAAADYLRAFSEPGTASVSEADIQS